MTEQGHARGAIDRRSDELQERIYQQAMVAELGQQALASTSFSALLQDAARCVVQTLHVEFCEILEILPEKGRMLLCAGAGWREGLVGSMLIGSGTDSQAGFTLLSREPVIVDDLATERRFTGSPLLFDHGVVSGMTVLIHGRERPFGIVGAHTAERRIFTHDDIHFLQSVANVLGLANERTRMEEEIARSRDQLAIILQGVDDGITVQDPTGRIVYSNDAAARLVGYPSPDAFLQAPLEEVMEQFELIDEAGHPLPTGDLPGRRALAGERPPEAVLGFRIRATGELRWSVVKAAPVLDERGEVQLAINVFLDITERKRAEAERLQLLEHERQARIQAEEAQRRFAFLAEASNVLASSLDYETTLDAVAHLAVPEIADWCVVDTFVADGRIERLAAAHVDPAKEAWAREVDRRYPPDSRGAAATALRTGRSLLTPEITEDMLPTFARDAEHLALLRELGMRSGMTVPMVARGRILGGITFLSTDSGRRFGSADLQLAEELADRAALAVDNARLYRESLRVAAEQEAILAHMADGVMMVDPTGALVYVNPAAYAILGIDTSVAGRDVTLEAMREIIQSTTREGEVVAAGDITLRRALQGETLVNVERQLTRPDGSEVVVQASAAPVVTEDGGQLGAVSVFRNITAERELERQKDLFLSAAAHDLKTPLTVIKSVAQMLQRRVARMARPELEPLSDGLRRIDLAVSRMAGQVNELLDISRIQMGQPLELARGPVDLVALARQVVAEVSHATERHHLAVRTDLDELTGVYDADRLERVLVNLLSNAVKYSPSGGEVVVTVGREDGDSGSWAVITVSDEGIGIPSADLPHIFERFYRARNVDERIPGTGIGLMGARQIVERHDGSIEVASEEGKGTTVTVRLPLSSTLKAG